MEKGCFAIVGGIILCMGLFIYGVSCWVIGIGFEQDVSGHLKRAADSNTIALAQEELHTAITYMEENDMTSGSSHIFYKTPECDINFWYKNLRSAYDELNEFPADADHLTISNQLMKLRETLLDDGGESGDSRCQRWRSFFSCTC